MSITFSPDGDKEKISARRARQPDVFSQIKEGIADAQR
jgi:hypothetical protein